MTFTYGEDLTNDRDYVRFHCADVIDGENFLSDAIIASLIATSADVNTAVIKAYRHIIARLSQPNFTADWLKVDFKTAREGYEKMLTDKMAEFGYSDTVEIPLSTSTVHTYRADSAATEVPDYSEGRDYYAI